MSEQEKDWPDCVDPLSYIAGLFDGEGSASLTVVKRRDKRGINYSFVPYIEIANTNKLILKAIENYLRLGALVFRNRRGRKRICRLSIRRHSECQKFINLLKKHVILKRPQLDLLEKALSLRELGKRAFIHPNPNAKTRRLKFPIESYLTLLEIAHKMRELNGHKKHVWTNLDSARKDIMNVFKARGVEVE